MESCSNNMYTLPALRFVGGETQEIAFDVFFYSNNLPFGLEGCKAEFAVMSYTNTEDAPLFRCDMEITSKEAGNVKNVLYLKLLPEYTMELCGKYVYQISIRDVGGDIEIPNHGVMYIRRNIDKAFVGEKINPLAYRR